MSSKVAGWSLQRHFQYLRGLQVFVAGLPLSAFTSQGNTHQYIFPPLGELHIFVAPMALVIVGLSGGVPWLLRRRKTLIVLALSSLAAAALASLTYLFILSLATATVHRTGRSSIHATVGTERTDFAIRNYPGTTDSELVKDFGSDDEDLEK